LYCKIQNIQSHDVAAVLSPAPAQAALSIKEK